MIYFISVILGLALGSFANVCILRLPKDQSIRTPRSYCPRCKKSLKIAHNIPLFSYLFLRGRCFFCQAPISLQYPSIEGLMALLFLFHAWMFGSSLSSLVLSDVLGFYLFTITIIDYQNRIIPDELSLSLLGIGILTSFANPYMAGSAWHKFGESVASTLGGGLFMLLMAWTGEKIFKKEAMGGGDVKLIAGTASVLGWQGIVGPLLIGSLGGGLVALALLLLRKKKFGETLPFGPFLSLGAYLVCLYPRLIPYLIGLDFRNLYFP
jgi:leader peptidase (prepilin peptidase)/N-methyltransferase